MKKTELVEIIRTLVKEEVGNALPQLLMEVLAEKMVQNSNSLLEGKKQAEQPLQKRTQNVSFEAPMKQPPVQAPKTYSTNPILNQILNETVGGIPNEESVSTPSAIDAIQSLPKNVLMENKEVAAVASAMTRDYSQLLKAIDAKAKSKRP
jgi:hypothetical protein